MSVELEPGPGAAPEATDGLDPDLPIQMDHDDRLIHWMLEKTPLERLDTLQDTVNGLAVLRNARRITE